MGENGRLEKESSPLVLMSMFNRVVDRVQDRVAVRNTKYKYLYLYLYLYGQPVRVTHPSKDRETQDYVRYRIGTRKRGT